MAEFQVTGYFDKAVMQESSVVVSVYEYRKGYKRRDGTMREDYMYRWDIIFKDYFKKYVSANFHRGQLVVVKGEVFPNKDIGSTGVGMLVLGQTLNLGVYPRNLSLTRRLSKGSMQAAEEEGMPDPSSFAQEDF